MEQSERSTVMTSKSLNNGIPLKPTKNKKSISDGDFTPNLVKKRGVYVDRKAFKSQEAYDYRTNTKPPPRPRPGQKKFLDSVLTILSKSTTGTQHPDTERADTKNTKAKTRSRLINETDTKTEKNYKQGKYKSRILSKNTNDDDDQFIILQSTRQIAQTPSNYSDATAFNDVQDENTKIRTIRDVLVNNTYNDPLGDKVGNVLEDKPNKKDRKIRIKDEPETIASEIKKEDDKKMYNLFFDLLESTFNDYNLKDVTLSDSNTTLEINESVANKLTINNEESNYETTKQIKKPSTVKEEKRYFDNPINIKLSNDTPLNHITPRLSIKSCDYPKKTNIPEVYRYPNKKYIKRNKKRNLLNIFKEELQIQPTCEEPVNLYQALKVMAKNKHKKNIYESSMNSENVPNQNNLDQKACVLKRRKIISMMSKKTSKIINRDIIGQKYSEFNSRMKKKDKNNRIPSNHSLKVFGYNYEDGMEIEKIYHTETPNANVKLTAIPSPFMMQSNLDYSTLLQFPDRSSYDFTY